MNDRAYQEIVAKFPRGDWLHAGHWRNTPLYERHPAAVECAMETLATLATPDWFLEEAKKWCTIANGGRVSSHPIVLGMLHPDYNVVRHRFQAAAQSAAQLAEDAREWGRMGTRIELEKLE